MACINQGGGSVAESKRRNEPRVVGVDSEEADEVLDALSSDTARRVVTHLNDEHATPSEIAEALDTSVQNVRYHLQNLEDAGVIEPVDMRYSSKGREMKVYAPSENPIVIFPRADRGSRLMKALTRFSGGVVLLAAAAFLIDALVNFTSGLGGLSASQSPSGSADTTEVGGGGGDGGAPTAMDTTFQGDRSAEYVGGFNRTELLEKAERVNESGRVNESAMRSLRNQINESAHRVNELRMENQELMMERSQLSQQMNETAAETGGDAATQASDGLISFTLTLSPGVVFFLGGAVVLTLAMSWWYFNRW